jgi:hypothetical protein
MRHPVPAGDEVGSEGASVRGSRVQVRGSRGVRSLAVGMTLALVLVACSSDGDEVETEVGGAALERGDDGAPVAVDDERGEVAEGEGLLDAPDETGAEEAEDDGTAAADASDAAGTSDPVDSGTAAGDGATSGGSAPSSGATPAPSPTPAPTPAPSPTATASPTPAPSPTPTPNPTPAPSPRVLAAGPATSGSQAQGLGDDGWVVTSSAGPVEPGDTPPPFRVDVDVRSEGSEPIGDAVCAVSLEAADDRGLVAQGRATVTLVLTAHDGSERRLVRQLLDLDVELAPGQDLRVDPSAPFAVDAREVASATCEARFEPN